MLIRRCLSQQLTMAIQVPAGSMPEGINAAGQPLHLSEPDTTSTGNKIRLHWRIENFVSFKDIMETRKIFSK